MERDDQMGGLRILVLSALSLIAADRAAAEQVLCVYHNRSYSDGAHICIQQQLMMTCAAESGRAIWRIVADERLARLCASPVATGRIAHGERQPRWPVNRRQAAAAPVNVPGSGKCFTFMGRRYCE
jgi:hypothetical protein